MEVNVAVTMIIAGLTSKKDETTMAYHGVILKTQTVPVHIMNGKDVVMIMIVMRIDHVSTLFVKRPARRKVKMIFMIGVFSNGGEGFSLSSSQYSAKILYDIFGPFF
jgi:hypothetical protein